jgi:hypothetical protein
MGTLDLTSPHLHDSMLVRSLVDVAYSIRFAKICHRKIGEIGQAM